MTTVQSSAHKGGRCVNKQFNKNKNLTQQTHKKKQKI
jgi:hypothetical protein